MPVADIFFLAASRSPPVATTTSAAPTSDVQAPAMVGHEPSPATLMDVPLERP